MNANRLDKQDRLKELLRQALPPIDDNPGPARDLWPAVLRRLDGNSAENSAGRPFTGHVPPRSAWLWFDWALLAGVGVLAAATPAWIPVFLYFL
jgi:hypothetical protein